MHLAPATVETYDDHRMAMAFALTGLRSEGVSIEAGLRRERRSRIILKCWMV